MRFGSKPSKFGLLDEEISRKGIVIRFGLKSDLSRVLLKLTVWPSIGLSKTNRTSFENLRVKGSLRTGLSKHEIDLSNSPSH